MNRPHRSCPLVRSALLLLLIFFFGLGCDSTPTMSPMTSGRIAYTALGASDAVGIGAFPVTEGYVYLVAAELRGVRAEVVVKNLGINGARMETFLSDELEAGVASNPDVVSIWVGSNDVVGGRDPVDFRRGLDTILVAFRTRTSARVFIGDLADLSKVPLYRSFPDPDVTRDRIDRFNAEIRASASAHGAFVVPISIGLPLDDSVFAIDGFHPSNHGHRLLADLFWAEIRTRI